MPFGNGWTDRPDEDWHTGFARYFWLQRGRWDVGSWALPFAVFADGEPDRRAAADGRSIFPCSKTFGTGSWLVALPPRAWPRNGDARRGAPLRLPDARVPSSPITGAFPTNEGSIRVSREARLSPERRPARSRPRAPRRRAAVPAPARAVGGDGARSRRGRGIRRLRAPVRARCAPQRWSVRCEPRWRSGTMSAWRCRSGPTRTSSTRSTSTSPRRRLRSSRRWRRSRRRSRGTAASIAAAAARAPTRRRCSRRRALAVARFVGCDNADDVVFVRNTTEAANLLAVALPPGTRVLCSPFEHHANLLPWRQHRVTHLPFTTTAAALPRRGGGRARGGRARRRSVLARRDHRRLERHRRGAAGRRGRPARHARGALVFVDAAQLAPHRRIDLHELGADFLAFSGHKVYAPFGTGVLVSPADGLADGSPLLHGGGAVRIVTLEGVAWAETPQTLRGRHAEPARCRRPRCGLRRAHVLRHGCRRRGRAAPRGVLWDGLDAIGGVDAAPPVDRCARPRRRCRVHGGGLGGARARDASRRPRDRRARRIVLRPSVRRPPARRRERRDGAAAPRGRVRRGRHDSRRRSGEHRARHDAGRHRRFPRRDRRGEARSPPPSRPLSIFCRSVRRHGAIVQQRRRRQRGVPGTGVRRPRHAGSSSRRSSATPRTRATWRSRADATAAGALVDASELESTAAATSVRVRNGDALVTDGPYAEVKESLGGYYLFSCDSLEDAIDWAAKIPAAWTRRRDRDPPGPRRRGGSGMKYAMLVYSDQSAWEALSEEEAAAAAGGVDAPLDRALRGDGEGRPERAGPRARERGRGEGRAGRRRRDDRHRRPVRRDEGAARRRLRHRPARPRRGDPARRARPRGGVRHPRDPAAHQSGERSACRGLCRGVAAVRRDPDPRPRRSRARRGRGAGCLCDGARALAADGHPGQPGRLDRHHRPQPRHRPDPS